VLWAAVGPASQIGERGTNQYNGPESGRSFELLTPNELREINAATSEIKLQGDSRDPGAKMCRAYRY
jgi:hypothetical protein